MFQVFALIFCILCFNIIALFLLKKKNANKLLTEITFHMCS